MDLDDSTQRNEPPEPTTWEARFTSNAVNADSELHVTVEGYDGGEHLFGPVVWVPHGATMPGIGDLALVTESDQGRWWVLVWVER